MADEKETDLTSVLVLNSMHEDEVGATDGLTDLDKIIGILEVLVDKVNELENHSHSIT